MAMEALRIAAKESKFMKFILGGFIFLAVGGLVFADVNGSFSGATGNTTVARVGDTKIDIRDFDQQLRGFLQQTGLSAEEAYQSGLINAFLNSRVDSLMMIEAAQDLNLRLDNQTVARQISQIFAGASKEQIEMTLRAQGMSEDLLASQIRTQTVMQFISAMPTGIANTLPNYMVKAHQALQSEARSGVLYTTSIDDLTDAIDITDADIQSYYNDNRSQFVIPEEREFVIGKMTTDMAKKDLPAITNDDVRAEYDANPDDFYIPETRKIAQAQFDNPDDAQAVYEAVSDGASLRDAVIKVTGSDDGYLAAQSYMMDGMPTELADVAFKNTINKGDVTPPVKTLLGNVVMQVESITPESQKSFESVQSDIKTRLTEAQIHDALYNKMIDAEDALDRGESFATIAAKTELKITTTQSLTQTGLIEATGDLKSILDASPSLNDELFNLTADGATYPLEIDDNSFVILGVHAIKPETIIPMTDVRADIEKSIKSTRKTAMAKSKADDITQRLNSGDITIDAAITDYGLTSKPFQNETRAKISANTDLIFQTAKGKYGFTMDENKIIIATVSAVKTSETNPLTDEEKGQVASQQKSIIDSLLNGYYRDKTKITVNDTLLKRTYSGISVQ